MGELLAHLPLMQFPSRNKIRALETYAQISGGNESWFVTRLWTALFLLLSEIGLVISVKWITNANTGDGANFRNRRDSREFPNHAPMGYLPSCLKSDFVVNTMKCDGVIRGAIGFGY